MIRNGFRAPFNGGGTMSASLMNLLAVLTTRKTIVVIAAVLLLAAASGWAMTGGSLEFAAGSSGHYNLQPIW